MWLLLSVFPAYSRGTVATIAGFSGDGGLATDAFCLPDHRTTATENDLFERPEDRRTFRLDLKPHVFGRSVTAEGRSNEQNMVLQKPDAKRWHFSNHCK